MSLNEVKIAVREYPDDLSEYATLYVTNHWNHRDRAVLEVNAKRYVFLISDLRKALNAVEAAR